MGGASSTMNYGPQAAATLKELRLAEGVTTAGNKVSIAGLIN